MKNAQYIDAYISGELSGEKLLAFVMELNDDLELQELVEGYADLKKVSELVWEAELLAEVEEKALEDCNINLLSKCA